MTSALLTLAPLAALACSPIGDERSAATIRAASEPVSTDSACRMINGGVYDNLTLERAENLGNGRISQAIGENNFLVLLGDCYTREVTILRGAVTSSEEGPCSTFFQYAPVVGANTSIALSQGADLHELVALATAGGATELNPSEFFFEFGVFFGRQGLTVGRRDRFNLLCGCGLYYPNSPGAS